MRGGLRRRLTIAVTVISALTLLLLVGGFNVTLRSSLNADADRLLQARAEAALEGVNVVDGKVTIQETSDAGAPDAQVWIYSGRRIIERPPVEASLDALANSLQESGGGTIDDAAGDNRLYGMPIQSGGANVGTVVAGVSLVPYERTAQRALYASILLGAVVLILIAIATRLILNRALRPVARMTADAADWSEHDLDRRFNVGAPTDELTELAATFDAMLDRMAAMVRHERNFTAEVSHELRTPLSSIAAESEVALRRERAPDQYRHSLERISTRSTELAQILETLLSVARAEGSEATGESCELGEVVETALQSIAPAADGYDVVIESDLGTVPLVVQGSAQAVQRVIAPLLENAVVYAHSRVRVVASMVGSEPTLLIADDGPGVGSDEREAVFDPGRRGSAERNPAAPPGTGLGLALSRRLARAMGGDVHFAEPVPEGGASVIMTLPPTPGHA